MKRVLIFVLLGPLLGSLVVAAPASFDARMSVLPLAYMYGSGPALATGLIDRYLANWLALLYRVIATAFVGYLATAIGFGLAAGAFTGVFLFGILGVIPAALCSLIAGWGESPSRVS